MKFYSQLVITVSVSALEVVLSHVLHVQMFRATVGHADGNLRPVYLLISDHALYVLSRTEKKTYKKKATVALREIDYIAVRYLSFVA